MRAFARFKNEIWCMDLAYVDKLAKDNNGVKYLLVRQDLFDRIVDAKGMKKKDSKETVKTFSKMITKKNRPKKIWADQGTEFAGEFKKLCSDEGIEIYSSMSETKAAFAERTIRSLKNILYHYKENYGYKYIHKLPQFIATMNSRNNRTRVEVSEQISAEQRCFRDFKKFSADQRCFRTVQRWFSLNQRCSALDLNELRNRRKGFV